MKIDRVIETVRRHRLDEMMTTGSVAGKPGFSGSADDAGPVAGYDKPMKPLRKRYIWTKGIRKNWKKKDEG